MKLIIMLMLCGIVMPACAGVHIYGTRIIYPAQNNEITVQLMNDGNRNALVQSWIDDGDTDIPPEELQVPFIISPPVTRITAGSGQQLKIKKIPNRLPTDRESLFFLNVLDIPPNPEKNEEKNAIKFAMQNRIKFIHRPNGIAGVGHKTFAQISISNTRNAIIIRNKSANWITIPDVTGQSKINNKTLLLSPYSTTPIDTNKFSSYYTITIIDDYGNYLHKKFKTG